MKSIGTDTVTFTLRDDGIVIGRAINPGVQRNDMNVAEALDRLEGLAQGQSLAGLWDPRAVSHFPPEAWRTLVTRLDRTLVALAILVDESTERAVTGFASAIDALLIPVAIFRQEDEAIAWLTQFGGPQQSDS